MKINQLPNIEYFILKEFFVHCTSEEIAYFIGQSGLRYIFDLAMYMNEFRRYINRTIIITSGYRGKLHNARVGGSPTSQHLSGGAVDFFVPDLPMKVIFEKFDKFVHEYHHENDLGQVIWYPSKNIMHVAIPSLTYPRYTPFINNGNLEQYKF